MPRVIHGRLMGRFDLVDRAVVGWTNERDYAHREAPSRSIRSPTTFSHGIVSTDDPTDLAFLPCAPVALDGRFELEHAGGVAEDSRVFLAVAYTYRQDDKVGVFLEDLGQARLPWDPTTPDQPLTFPIPEPLRLRVHASGAGAAPELRPAVMLVEDAWLEEWRRAKQTGDDDFWGREAVTIGLRRDHTLEVLLFPEFAGRTWNAVPVSCGVALPELARPVRLPRDEILRVPLPVPARVAITLALDRDTALAEEPTLSLADRHGHRLPPVRWTAHPGEPGTPPRWFTELPLLPGASEIVVDFTEDLGPPHRTSVELEPGERRAVEIAMAAGVRAIEVRADAEWDARLQRRARWSVGGPGEEWRLLDPLAVRRQTDGWELMVPARTTRVLVMALPRVEADGRIHFHLLHARPPAGDGPWQLQAEDTATSFLPPAGARVFHAEVRRDPALPLLRRGSDAPARRGFVYHGLPPGSYTATFALFDGGEYEARATVPD